MKKFIPLLFSLFVLVNVSKAGCDPAFTVAVQQATAQVQATNVAPGIFHDWHFGNQGQAYGPTASFTFSAPGVYTITHIVVDSLNNCIDSSQQAVTINFQDSCAASFTAIRDSFQLNRYYFYSTSVASSSINSYNWTLDGTAISNSASFAYTLPAGTHTICLAITTVGGCSSSVCDSDQVTDTSYCNWTASFTAHVSPANPMQISFVPSPSFNTMVYNWNFGDGHSSTQKTPVHIYSQAGTYTVLLFITDTLNGCHDSTWQQIQVIDSTADSCAASFTAVGDTLQLNRYYFYSTSVASSSISSYNWTLDNTNISNSSSFAYTLPAGTHTICLNITTTGGCSSTVCDTIQVADTIHCNWTASFTATTFSSNPKKISFVPSPSLNGLLYNWNFGDGHSSTQKTPVHTYSQAGIYTVTLFIADTLNGCHDSTWQQIHVNSSPSDSCTVSFTYTVNPSHSNKLTFTVVSNQTITSQVWLINHLSNPYDSVVLTSNNPTYTFTDTGYYSVCLYVITGSGCTGHYCDNIYIGQLDSRMAGMIPSYPNPVTGTNVNLRLELTQESKLGITVFDLSGNAVYSQQKEGVAGMNSISIPVPQLRPGQYFIDIHYGGLRKRSQFQKM